MRALKREVNSHEHAPPSFVFPVASYFTKSSEHIHWESLCTLHTATLYKQEKTKLVRLILPILKDRFKLQFSSVSLNNSQVSK